VLREHNVEYTIWDRLAEGERKKLKRWYLRLLASRLEAYERQTVGTFDGLIAITQEDASLLHRFAPKAPIHVSPACINMAEWPEVPAPKALKVGFIGSLDWRPNQEGLDWFLENVWGRVINKVPGASFTIAGKKMPARYGHTRLDGVHALGQVPNARAFMQSMDVLIAPLFSGSGMRVKALECMAAGRPLVATAMAMDGIGTKPGLHVELADTTNAFANELVHLLKHPDKAAAMGVAGREFVASHFAADAVSESLLAWQRHTFGLWS
jgi:glycosyltransferase involved in cell wall biosynthesis